MARRKPVPEGSDANEHRSALCPVCRKRQGLTERGTFMEHRYLNCKSKPKPICEGSHRINKSVECRLDWLSSRPKIDTVYLAYPPQESDRVYKVTLQFVGDASKGIAGMRQVIEHKYLGVALNKAIKWCKDNRI